MRTRWATLAIMPRTSGVSFSSVTRPILLSLRPINVERCEWWRRIALPICSTLIVFAALAIVINSVTRPRARILLFGNRFGVAADPARLQRRNLDIAPCRNRARRILVLERVEGRANHVVGVGRANRLGHHVLDAERLEHRAHRTAGDDPGSGRCRAQVNAPRAVTARDIVMQRAAFAQRHASQIAFRSVGRLSDRFGNLARLAVAETDPALLVADHDQRRKAEALAALDHFRHTVDVDELIDELAVAFLAIPASFASAAFAFTCHGVFQSLRGFEPLSWCPLKFLETQSAFARGIRERLDAAVIKITAAVEDDLFDAVFHGPLRE